MALRINPAKLLLWRNPTDLQIGLDDPLIFEGVTENQERLLSLLERGVADDALETTETQLLERLTPVLLQNSRITKPTLSGEFIRGAFAELIRASFATNLDGIAVLEARARVTVHLDSLGAGGFLIALGLASAGIGRVLTSDSALVGEHDVSPLAYPSEAKGQSRVAALNQVLRARPGEMKVELYDALTEAKRRHSLRIITAQNALHPASHVNLRLKNLPHIAALFGSRWVSVSPPITQSPCLSCLDLHNTDADPLWPTLASQLVGRVEYLEDARSALFAASMVVGEIIRAIDTPTAEAEFIGHRLDVASGRIEEWSWPRHPECDCG
jgi:hypothetical protein